MYSIFIKKLYLYKNIYKLYNDRGVFIRVPNLDTLFLHTVKSHSLDITSLCIMSLRDMLLRTRVQNLHTSCVLSGTRAYGTDKYFLILYLSFITI